MYSGSVCRGSGLAGCRVPASLGPHTEPWAPIHRAPSGCGAGRGPPRRAYLHPDGLVRHAAHHVADGAEELQQGLHEVGLTFVFIESAKGKHTPLWAWRAALHLHPCVCSQGRGCPGGKSDWEATSSTSMGGTWEAAWKPHQSGPLSYGDRSAHSRSWFLFILLIAIFIVT